MIKLIAILIVLLIPFVSFGTELYNENMDGYADKAAAMAGPWPDALDGDITLESGAACRGGSGKCWKMEWSAGDTLQYASLPVGRADAYIRFYFKQGNMLDKGSKVLKLHGSQTGTGYSNSTFSQAYASGIWREVSSGDGSGTVNDSTSLGRYTLSSASQFPGSTVVTYTPTWTGYEIVDGNWHCVEVYVKMNTNTDTTLNNDGEYDVWVDGTLIYKITGLNNRHYLNTREIANAAFGVYTSEAGLIQYYDDFVVSDSYVGLVGDTPAPTPTGSLSPGVSAAGVTFR